MADITKILLRRDTETNWNEVNPILDLGEPGLAVDSNGNIIGFKIGDGIHTWEDLVYLSGDFSAIAQRVSELEVEFTTLDEEINGTATEDGLKQMLLALDNKVNDEETGLDVLNFTVGQNTEDISTNTSAISDLNLTTDSLTRGLQAEALARTNADERLEDLIDTEELNRRNADAVVKADLEAEIKDITDLIPVQASVENQLADKNFVNSSIATNTANFIGTFETVSDLLSYAGVVTNNDYAFVVNSVIKNNGNDFTNVSELNLYDTTLLTNYDYAWVVNGSNFDLYRFDIILQAWDLRVQDTSKNAVTLNTAYNRYKYNGESWVYEYTLNNSSFTANQWAAINSGITASKVAEIQSYSAGTGLQLDGTTFSMTGSLPYIDAVTYPNLLPDSDNVDGGIRIVLTDDENATRYNGYWYIVIEPQL